METSMRIFGAAVLAASLLVTNAFAGTTLPSGKPAGVKKAQMMENNTILIVAGIGLAGLGIGLAASAGNAGGPTTSTSSSTSTSSTSTTS
jgi:hypothetical protein